MSRNPGRLAWPVLVMFVGAAMALPSAGLALGPGVADVEQPVARLVFPTGLMVLVIGLVWLPFVVLNRRTR